VLHKLRARLTYGNVVATIALFIALATGGAYAANTIRSTDIVDGEVKTPDLANSAVTGAKVANGSLLIQDLAPVARDSCPAGTSRFGDICAGSVGAPRTWGAALDYCAARGLRVPSLPEATVLGRKYDIPGIEPRQQFWTDESYGLQEGGSLPQYAFTSDEDGGLFSAGNVSNTNGAVLTPLCVTDLSDGG
jgi:hypothetical protein